jgi:hypothetical protein
VEQVPKHSRALLAKTLLDIAQTVAAQEQRIKQELLRSATAGDLPRVVDLLNRWMTRPVGEVLEESSNSLRGRKRQRSEPAWRDGPR